jgi:hypothetical protein
MCDTCRVLQEKLARRMFQVLLSRVAVTRAPLSLQFDQIKQLNEAELELRVAQDLYRGHQIEHLDRMVS